MEEKQYDVCLSFAGEDRVYIDPIAKLLRDRGIQVFYDEFKTVDLWGRDLSIEFDLIYRKSSRYFIPFISKNYKEKVWTKHEFRTALSRSLADYGYILPIRLDDTELDGLRPTISYLNYSDYSVEEIAGMIIAKVNGESIEVTRSKIKDDTLDLYCALKVLADHNYQSIEMIGISFTITCRTKDYRYVNEPSIQFEKQIFGNADSMAFARQLGKEVHFPIKLEHGQQVSVTYALPKASLDTWKKIDPSITFRGIVSTTLGEVSYSQSLTVKKVIETFEFSFG